MYSYITLIDLISSYFFLISLFIIFYYGFQSPANSFLFGSRPVFTNTDLKVSSFVIIKYKTISILSMFILVSTFLYITIKTFGQSSCTLNTLVELLVL